MGFDQLELMDRIAIFQSFATKDNVYKAEQILSTGKIDIVRPMFMDSLRFSGSGIRTVNGIGFCHLNEVTANVIGVALSSFLKGKFAEVKADRYPGTQKRKRKVIIGFDTRVNSRFLGIILGDVLYNKGYSIFIPDIPSTSAFISGMVVQLNCCMGLLVTGGHNMENYTGLKFFTPDRYQIDNSLIEELEKLIARSNPTRLKGLELLDFDLDLQLSHYNERSVHDVSNFIDKNNNFRSRRRRLFIYDGLSGNTMIYIDFIQRSRFFDDMIRECTLRNNFRNPEIPEAFHNAILQAEACNRRFVMIGDIDGDRFGYAEKVGDCWKIYSSDEIAAVLALFFIETEPNPRLLVVGTELASRLLKHVVLSEGMLYKRVGIKQSDVVSGIQSMNKKHRADIRQMVVFTDSHGFIHDRSLERDTVTLAVLWLCITQYKLPSLYMLEIDNKYGVWPTYKVLVRVDDAAQYIREVLQRLQSAELHFIVSNSGVVKINFGGYTIKIRGSHTEELVKILGYGEDCSSVSLKRKMYRFCYKILGISLYTIK